MIDATIKGELCNMKFPFKCQIHNCNVDVSIPKENHDFNVLVHCTEPRNFKSSNETIEAHHEYYDLILTSEIELLRLKNAELMAFGSCSLQRKDFFRDKKKFGVSFLYSRGNGAYGLRGYELREEIWNRQEEIKIPRFFWTSNSKRAELNTNKINPYPYKTKAELMDTMYTIVIENSMEHNYFTEKLIDSLCCFTIPIYAGCPNINKYFSSSAIISAYTADDIIKVCNQLSQEEYEKKLSALANSFMKAWEYTSFDKRLYREIMKGYYKKISLSAANIRF
jgi:hypothetical protein